MPGFIYSPLPEDHPTDEATYYARKARKQSEAMAARLAANPLAIPDLTQIYRESDPERQAEARQRKQEIASSPHAFVGQGMPLPRNDPKAIEARLKMINPE